MKKTASKLKTRTLEVIIAAVVNLALIALLIVYLSSGTEKLLLSILLPAAVHISLCGTLLLFFYTDTDIRI